SVETLPNVVSVHPVGSAAFVITWEGSGLIIKSAVVNSQCAVNPAGVVQVSTVASALTPAVAANGDRIFTTWIVGGNVRGRIANGANNFLTADTQILAKTATESIQYVRVAPSGDGFVIVVRWVVDGANTGPSRIEAYRTNNAGVIQGPPTLVTTRTGSNFLSSQSFGVSQRRADGALLIVWHSCDEFGDLSGCGVFGRILRPNGVPVGEEFNLATTTENNQENPAATALPGGAFAATWMDESQKDPDKSGTSVRARVLYPPYDDARNVIGAICTTTADCGMGLACGASSDGGSRCFATCTPPLCPGGGTCAAADGGNACLF
ncbi:MAG: VBCS repeat-containing protein, partial [Acidimicrobiaceae bacterium]